MNSDPWKERRFVEEKKIPKDIRSEWERDYARVGFCVVGFISLLIGGWVSEDSSVVK